MSSGILEVHTTGGAVAKFSHDDIIEIRGDLPGTHSGGKEEEVIYEKQESATDTDRKVRALFEEGLSQSEISNKTGIPEPAVEAWAEREEQRDLPGEEETEEEDSGDSREVEWQKYTL